MSSSIRVVLIFGIGIAALSACNPSLPPTIDPSQVQATVDGLLTEAAPAATDIPPSTAAPAPTTGPSFEATTYRDEVAGYELDHPEGWFVGPVEQYSRGGITAFTSYERPTDVLPDATPPGETRMDATVQLWDPKGDLEAFAQQRLGAWEASGNTVVLDEEWTLSDGRAAKAYLVTGTDGVASYFFLTTLGDNYLVLSGGGDLALLAEIAHSVRPISFVY